MLYTSPDSRAASSSRESSLSSARWRHIDDSAAAGDTGSWDFMPPAWRPRRSDGASRSMRRQSPSRRGANRGESDAPVTPPLRSSDYDAGPSSTAAAAPPVTPLIDRRHDDGHADDSDCIGHSPGKDRPGQEDESGDVTQAMPGATGKEADEHQQVAALRRRIAQLEEVVQDKAWALQRALELGDAVARLEETNADLVDALADAKRSAEASAQKIHDLEANLALAAQVNRILHAGQDACTRCAVRDERDRRQDIVLAERAAIYGIECEWLTFRNVMNFAKGQSAEVETELMWAEDQLAHAREHRRMQAEVDTLEAVKRKLRAVEADAERWKGRYRDLKEKGRAHIEELNEIHEENLRRARATYLRCNPNHAVLLWGLGHVARLTCERFNHVEQLASVAKELLLLKQELQVMKNAQRATLQMLSSDVQSALRVCLPVLWAPSHEVQHDGTPTAAASGGASSSPGRTRGRSASAGGREQPRSSSGGGRPRLASPAANTSSHHHNSNASLSASSRLVSTRRASSYEHGRSRGSTGDADEDSSSRAARLALRPTRGAAVRSASGSSRGSAPSGPSSRPSSQSPDRHSLPTPGNTTTRRSAALRATGARTSATTSSTTSTKQPVPLEGLLSKLRTNVPTKHNDPAAAAQAQQPSRAEAASAAGAANVRLDIVSASDDESW